MQITRLRGDKLRANPPTIHIGVYRYVLCKSRGQDGGREGLKSYHKGLVEVLCVGSWRRKTG